MAVTSVTNRDLSSITEAVELLLESNTSLDVNNIACILKALSELTQMDTIHLFHDVYNQALRNQGSNTERDSRNDRLINFLECLACVYGKMGSN